MEDHRHEYRRRKYPHIIGVDTRARTHTYAIISTTTTGARASREAFPVTAAGMKRAIAWIGRNTTGQILVAAEGIASYGASLTRALGRENVTVVVVKPPRMQARAGVGKTDGIDATAAALSNLGMDLLQNNPGQGPLGNGRHGARRNKGQRPGYGTLHHPPNPVPSTFLPTRRSSWFCGASAPSSQRRSA